MSPIKPTREDAASTSDPKELYESAGSNAVGGQGGHPAAEERQDAGGAVGNQKNPPHVTETDRAAPRQEKDDRAGDVAALPANASGSAEKPAETGGIRSTSAYEGRPEEDKNQPPSERDK